MNQPWSILTNPDPRLRERSREVDVARIKTPKFQKFADDLAAFMIASNGIGLAAPQVGIPERVIAVLINDKATVYVNPEIAKTSSATELDQEGCLSVPNVWGTVERAKRATVRALDRHGRRVTLNLSGLSARVFQHEIDHLNGVLFIDKVKEHARGRAKTKV